MPRHVLGVMLAHRLGRAEALAEQLAEMLEED
jgi:hypothetical protein